MVHVEGILPSEWQTTPCKRMGRKKDGCNLACQGITFLPPDTAARLLGSPRNIAEASQTIPPLLSGRAPPYEEALEWLQFAYTGDRSGTYVAPYLNGVTFYTPEEGEPLFALALQQLCTLYPRAYD